MLLRIWVRYLDDGCGTDKWVRYLKNGYVLGTVPINEYGTGYGTGYSTDKLGRYLQNGYVMGTVPTEWVRTSRMGTCWVR